MTQCFDCQILSIEALRLGDVPWKMNLTDLIDSAEQGCPLCLIAWTMLQTDCGDEDIESHLRDVRQRYSERGDGDDDDDDNEDEDLRIYLAPRFDEAEFEHDRELCDAKVFSPCEIEVRIGVKPSSADPNHGPQRFRVSSMGVFAHPGTVAGRYIRGRWLSPGSQLDECLSWASRRLSECEKYHPECNSALDREMPTRVIDLGQLSWGNRLTIAETHGRTGKYVALSYCWGAGVRPQVKLTQASYNALLGGFDCARLSRSHQQAVRITQILGYRYIWIDALCIIQDDSADWERESARMTECYQNAALTIVAGRSDNSLAGFLEDPCTPTIAPARLEYTHSDVPGEVGEVHICIHRSVANGPVEQRAWCFQEDLLSRRKLIFGTDQILLDCVSRQYHESGIVCNYISHKDEVGKDIFKSLNLDPVIKDPAAGRESVLDAWYSALERYSDLAMFDPHDIFAALNGIAKRVQTLLCCRYLAGLWEDDIIRGMLWHGADNVGSLVRPLTRPVERNAKKPQRLGLPAIRAPSWSWASVEGPVYRGIGQADPAMFASANHCVRPVHCNPVRWTRQTDCDVGKAYMPVCELEMIGAVKAVVCSSKPMSQQMKEDSSWRLAFSGAAPVKFAPLVDPQALEHIVGVGRFDVDEERRDFCWCMRLIKDRGLLLQLDNHGKFHRVGKFIVLDEAAFQNVAETQVCLV